MSESDSIVTVVNLISPTGSNVSVPSMFIFSIVVGALPGESATTSTPMNDTGTNRINKTADIAKSNTPKKIFSLFFIGLRLVCVLNS